MTNLKSLCGKFEYMSKNLKKGFPVFENYMYFTIQANFKSFFKNICSPQIQMQT